MVTDKAMELARQIGRVELAYEWSQWLETPCQDYTEGKPRQANFDEAAKLTSMAAIASAGAEFSKLPVELQFMDREEWFTSIDKHPATPPPASADALGEVADSLAQKAFSLARKKWAENPLDCTPPWEEQDEFIRNEWRDMAGYFTAALSAMSPAWQDIATLDTDSGLDVIVAEANGTVGEAYFHVDSGRDNGWWWANTNWGDYPEPHRPTPTHWQPLPTPPETRHD